MYHWQTGLEFLDRIKYLLYQVQLLNIQSGYVPNLNNTTNINAYFDQSRSNMINETMINQSVILDTSDIFHTNE